MSTIRTTQGKEEEVKRSQREKERAGAYKMVSSVSTIFARTCAAVGCDGTPNAEAAVAEAEAEGAASD